MSNEKKTQNIMEIQLNDGNQICLEGANPKFDSEILAVQLDRHYKVSGTMFIPLHEDEGAKYFTLYFPMASVQFFTMYQRDITEEFLKTCTTKPIEEGHKDVQP